MKKLSGWQKAGLFAGVGCLSIVAMIVVAVVGAVIWARAAVENTGDATPIRSERAIALAPATATAPIAGGTPTGASTPQRLTIALQEGQFTVRPDGEAGQVQVGGTWAPGLFELVDDREGGDTTIRFRSTGPSGLLRFLAGLGGADAGAPPQVSVRIPPGVPIDLRLQVSMGESTIDLGGLTLRELELDLSMGEHRVDFGQPLTARLRRLQLDASMGNVAVEHLGNAQPQTLVANGNMGNLTADFGGAWTSGGADVSFEQSMGELTLRVPQHVRVEGSGGTASAPGAGVAGEAPVLRLRVNTSMGESRVLRY